MSNIAKPPLPEIFLTHMRKLLGENFPAFETTMNEQPWRGIRLNPLKPHNEKFFESSPIPWCPEARAFRDENFKPGQTLEYLAGLFYIQEPSAMLPAALLAAQPGERVLDLCAAPGGKTTQIAGAMQGRGLLIANDASPARAQALVRNIERAGVRNAVVLTEQPRKLKERFAGYFDAVLIDAPCSGEGMFRRDTDVLKAYTANKPASCAAVQAELLHHAAAMVRAGGRLVYSTCTFNTTENEEIIEKFLTSHEDFSLEEIKHKEMGVAQGFGKISAAARILPHGGMGEGHFAAVLRRRGDSNTATRTQPPPAAPHRLPAKSPAHVAQPPLPAPFITFCQDFLHEDFLLAVTAAYHPILHAQHLYLQPALSPTPLDLRGLRTTRSGWHVGEISKERFTPSQGLAMALRKDDARYCVELSDADAWRYLRGESLSVELTQAISSLNMDFANKPYTLICHNTHPLGWARLVADRLKNLLPTGWVRQ